MPRSAIIWTRSRELSLNAKYHRTHSTIISWSKCRPLKRSCAEVGSVIPGVTAVHRSFQVCTRTVLASGRNINVLVLDTEVYSNTGGQASKATPLGAVALFAKAGKRTARKDLAMQAISYGNVYVATVAMGANPQQTLDAFREAEAYDGPSLIVAYSHCIAHGIDMRQGMKQQVLAVASGHWPLMRFDPALRRAGLNPFQLDSPRPTIPLKEYQATQLRYKSLVESRPQEAAELSAMAQVVATERYRKYEELARTDGSRFHPATESVSEACIKFDDPAHVAADAMGRVAGFAESGSPTMEQPSSDSGTPS